MIRSLSGTSKTSSRSSSMDGRAHLQRLESYLKVSVTPSTTVRAGGNVVGEFHDICCGGGWTNFKPGRTGSGTGIAGASRIVVGGVRPQRDERSKVRAVRGDQILNARLLAPKPAS